MPENMIIAGGMGGVFVPIVIEFAAKGQKVSDQIPMKWSGVAGVIGGIVPLGLHFAKPAFYTRLSEDTKRGLLAFGGASLATGASILILDELRKREMYTFQEVPLGRGYHSEGLTERVYPEGIKEI